jgi:hypothetical protein
MPYISSIGSSALSGIGFFNPFADETPAPEATNMWFKPPTLESDNSWELEENWWLDSACTEPANALPSAYTDIVLKADCTVHVDPSFTVYTSNLGNVLDVNNNTLFVVGHTLEHNAAWDSLTEEQKDEAFLGIGSISQYNCASAVAVDISRVTNSETDSWVPVDEADVSYSLYIQEGHVDFIAFQ